MITCSRGFLYKIQSKKEEAEEHQPRYFRSAEGHRVGWEIHSLGTFFLTISFKHLEIQINRWG